MESSMEIPYKIKQEQVYHMAQQSHYEIYALSKPQF